VPDELAMRIEVSKPAKNKAPRIGRSDMGTLTRHRVSYLDEGLSLF
jgi:hypothetical protein